MNTSKLIRLPSQFFYDHLERDLPTPVIVRENKKSVYVSSDDANLSDLLSDAEFYATGSDHFDSDYRYLMLAADRLLKAYQKQVA